MSAEKGVAWDSGSRKAGKMDFRLQDQCNKPMIDLHTEQVQNAAAKFEKAASSLLEKCKGLLLRIAHLELNQHQIDYLTRCEKLVKMAEKMLDSQIYVMGSLRR